MPVLSANLDALLNFTQLWQWSSEDFEKAYVVKLADPEPQEKPLGLSSVGCLLGFRRHHHHARRLSQATCRRLKAVQRQARASQEGQQRGDGVDQCECWTEA